MSELTNVPDAEEYQPGDALWVTHCDDPSCDLGTFQYRCPVCRRWGKEYEVWWRFNDVVLNDQRVQFDCERCDSKLEAYYVPDEHETRVRLIE